IPEFGVQQGVSPDRTDNCKNINNANIPGSCPPKRGRFIRQLNANVAAGHAINNPGVQLAFPGQLQAVRPRPLPRRDRHALTVPVLDVHKLLRRGAPRFRLSRTALTPSPESLLLPPLSPPPRHATLVPDFGVRQGRPPRRQGNCKGVNDINISCSCLPKREEFVTKLNENVAVGHATNNSGIGVSFPTGNSKGEQQAHIIALTLQNLNSPGVGCPAVSTVYGQLQQQINAL
ncbi:hypothetical protein C8Q74DRAFT_1409131, partial [Fomes fomentarius]